MLSIGVRFFFLLFFSFILCFSFSDIELVWKKKSSDVFDGRINAWFMEINTAYQIILKHIHIHSTQLLQKPVHWKCVIWSVQIYKFTFWGLFFFTLPCFILYFQLFMPNCKTFSVCKLFNTSWKNTFLQSAFTNTLVCSRALSLNLSLFLLRLLSDISSHSYLLGVQFWPKRNSWVAFQLKGFIHDDQDIVVFYYAAGFHFYTYDRKKNANVVFSHFALDGKMVWGF